MQEMIDSIWKSDSELIELDRIENRMTFSKPNGMNMKKPLTGKVFFVCGNFHEYLTVFPSLCFIHHCRRRRRQKFVFSSYNIIIIGCWKFPSRWTQTFVMVFDVILVFWSRTDDD